MTTISILGYEQECYCDHCGRALQHGVKVTGFGTIGADCFNKLIKADRKRFSGNGKPGSTLTRTLAKLRERDSSQQLSRMGYSDRHFVFELAE
jgi:hypothetical protein